MPATIIKSACRGVARKAPAPKRSRSNRLAPAAINWVQNDIRSLSIRGGNGLNTYHIVNTPQNGVAGGVTTTLGVLAGALCALQAKPQPVAPRSGDFIVAIVNQELVTSSEVLGRIGRIRADAARARQSLPPEAELRPNSVP